MRFAPALGLMVCVASLAAASPLSSPWPQGVDLPPGEPVSEDYRHQFDLCDREATFRGHTGRYNKGCAGDPNLVTALRRLPGGAIAFVSKLAVDLDGSAFACGPNHGRMDQCPTSMMLVDIKGREVPVDSDQVPYVVIPEAGPADVAGEFTRLTGVRVGDFGVVISGGKMVPVIVADTGPYSKLGEGSLALHRALGHEECSAKDSKGVCSQVDDEGQSINSNVTTILFPGTARSDLTPANITATTRREGLRLWGEFQTHNAS